eukprot:CAMPEP_0179210946 /NCGR_PEP_ID=MMETSP0797-20121207/78_1 /TAXON_ID=47934 /ORGANISM="Dinophysis acuminata, Strain DAEP01" /LENGTH=160 /DNA_ID=CAMNT_0020915995 /DNA_START=40 /DNA_END=519 /DNA_ORIENTATION=-
MASSNAPFAYNLPHHAGRALLLEGLGVHERCLVGPEPRGEGAEVEAHLCPLAGGCDAVIVVNLHAVPPLRPRVACPRQRADARRASLSTEEDLDVHQVLLPGCPSFIPSAFVEDQVAALQLRRLELDGQRIGRQQKAEVFSQGIDHLLDQLDVAHLAVRR